jgi:hypothetical protein
VGESSSVTTKRLSTDSSENLRDGNRAEDQACNIQCPPPLSAWVEHRTKLLVRSGPLRWVLSGWIYRSDGLILPCSACAADFGGAQCEAVSIPASGPGPVARARRAASEQADALLLTQCLNNELREKSSTCRCLVSLVCDSSLPLAIFPAPPSTPGAPGPGCPAKCVTITSTGRPRGSMTVRESGV